MAALKQRAGWVLVAALALFTSIGCAPGETRGRGGTAVIGFLAEAQSMNEFVSADANSDELQRYVLFTTLIRYDEDLKPRPRLAERWDTTRTGGSLELVFRLRRDVHWHDGVPTTAHDVKFTFDRIKDPATAYPHASFFERYDSAVVRDSFTISFYLKPHVGYLDPWRSVAPMPEHILGHVPPERLAQHPFGTTSPVGNGPFRFVEHRPGDRWIFEANPDFPEGLGGSPRLDRLVYRVIPEPTTLLGELLAGAVDLYVSATPGHARAIRENPNTRLITYPSRSYVFIAWNSRHPFLAEPRARRALTQAIDRRRIVEVARSGLGAIAFGPVPPFHWAQHPELEPLPYDPAAATALLREAGWVDRDGDGVRERDGVTASFELKTHPQRVREDIMGMVQADLARIGVDVRTRVQEAQSLLADLTSPDRRFDATVLGWTTEFRVDDRDLFACSALEGPFQFTSYCNPRVDSLLERAVGLERRTEAAPLWHEYQEIIQRDQPFTFLYYEVTASGVHDRLHDVRMDIRGSLLNPEEWWVDPETRSR